MKILFIDDEFHSVAPFYQAVSRNFPEPQHKCIHVVAKDIGQAIIRGPEKTDILILDVRMDDNDDAGIDFLTENCDHILSLPIPVIVLTNRAPSKIRERVYSLEFVQVECLGQKPIGELDDANNRREKFNKLVQVFQKNIEMLPANLVSKIKELRELYLL